MTVGKFGVFYLAFADDLVILSESVTGLNALLQQVATGCLCMGLEVNPSKCCPLSIKVDGAGNVPMAPRVGDTMYLSNLTKLNKPYNYM